MLSRLGAAAPSLDNPFNSKYIMQKIININIAVIPFKRGNDFASVCSDGEHVAAITNGIHQHFSSLWWAVDYLRELGFDYDWSQMKFWTNSSFTTLCLRRGFSCKQHGTGYGLFCDGTLTLVRNTLWECQFEAIKKCYTYKY